MSDQNLDLASILNALFGSNPATPESRALRQARDARWAQMLPNWPAKALGGYPSASPDDVFAVMGATRSLGGMSRLPSSSSLAIPDAPPLEIMNKNARVESVPIASTRATQPRMEWGNFKKGKHPEPLFREYADKPVAVRKENGEYLIFDGHHRTVSAANKGEKYLDMYVVDAKTYAPELAGRPPAAQTISDEELLRALSGGN